MQLVLGQEGRQVAGFRAVYLIKKAGASKFDPRKMLQPCLIGAAAGLLFGWSGQQVTGVEEVLEKAGTAGTMTALVQLATRMGGPILTNLLGNARGILKNLGK